MSYYFWKLVRLVLFRHIHPIPSHPDPIPSYPVRSIPSHPIRIFPSHLISSHPVLSITSHPVPSHPIPYHPIPSHIIPSHPIPSHLIPFHPVPSCPIPSYPISSCARPVLFHPIASHTVPVPSRRSSSDPNRRPRPAAEIGLPDSQRNKWAFRSSHDTTAAAGSDQATTVRGLVPDMAGAGAVPGARTGRLYCTRQSLLILTDPIWQQSQT